MSGCSSSSFSPFSFGGSQESHGKDLQVMDFVDLENDQKTTLSRERREVKEARLAAKVELSQQGGLVRPRQVVDHQILIRRAPFIPAYQHLDLYEEEDEDLGYVEPTESGSIISPTLGHNVKFDITSAMIQLLNLKGVFLNAAKDDTNMHITNFLRICTYCTIPRVDQEALRLRDSEYGDGTYAIVAIYTYETENDIVVQEVAQLRIDIGLLTKQFTSMGVGKDNGSDASIPIEERLGVEALTVVIMNFDSCGIEEYEEIISPLHGKGKLRSRWYGLFTVIRVYPYSALELKRDSEPPFKTAKKAKGKKVVPEESKSPPQGKEKESIYYYSLHTLTTCYDDNADDNDDEVELSSEEVNSKHAKTAEDLRDRVVGDQKALLVYPCMSLTVRVLELPKIDEIIEAQRTFDNGVIRDEANPLARLVRHVVDIFVGLFPQDDQTDTSATAEPTEVGAQIEGSHTNGTGTSSAPPPVQSVPPRPWNMHPDIMMISQAAWTKGVTK
ncbi:hypothetical protein FXO37_04142 [Capsicum annuum]|nr:hypothetical protein FXO37_04142 [Capsicum annuum]